MFLKWKVPQMASETWNLVGHTPQVKQATCIFQQSCWSHSESLWCCLAIGSAYLRMGTPQNVVQWTWASGVWPYNPNTFSHMIRPQFLTLFAHSLIVLQFLSLITHMQFVHHLLSPNTESELPQLYTDETSLCNISLHLTTDLITHTVISSNNKAIHAFPKSNPSSVPLGYLDSYSSLPWVMWEAVTGVEGIPCWELLWHSLANGALVYPSQDKRYRAEGCMALG